MIIKYNNFIIALLQIIIITIVLSSLLIEIFFKVLPCNLCTIERALWMLLLLTTIIFKSRLVMLIILAINLAVSLYQVALQQHLLQSYCPIDPTSTVPPCDLVTFKILYLSLAEINSIICVIMIVFIFMMVRNKKHNNNID